MILVTLAEEDAILVRLLDRIAVLIVDESIFHPDTDLFPLLGAGVGGPLLTSSKGRESEEVTNYLSVCFSTSVL